MTCAVTAAADERPMSPTVVISPIDDFAYPRMLGIPSENPGSAYADIDIFAELYGGGPAVGVYIMVLFGSDCTDLCVCDDAVHSGYTDDTGHLILNIRAGGCCEADVAVLVDGNIRERTYPVFVSPDLSHYMEGCWVELSDFDGTGETNLGDFVIFADAWTRSCPVTP